MTEQESILSLDEAKELTTTIYSEMQKLDRLVVSSQEDFVRAGESYKLFNEYDKKVRDFWDTPIKNAHTLHKSLVAKRDEMMEPITKTKSLIRAAMTKFQDEMERKRREEEARAIAAAKKAAEDAAIAKAVELEAKGRLAQAEVVMSTPVTVKPVMVKAEVPSGFGNITRKTWSAEVVSMRQLIEGVLAGTADASLIQPNLVVLNAMARSQKSAFNVPGVRAVEK